MKKSSLTREAWHWFPGFNHVDTGVSKTDRANPTKKTRLWTYNGHDSTGHGSGDDQFIPGIPLPTHAEFDHFPGIDLDFVREQTRAEAGLGDFSVRHGFGFGYAHSFPHSGDFKVLKPVSKFRYEPFSMGGTLFVSRDQSAMYSHHGVPLATGVSFDGGLYVPEQRPTCGGNAMGTPCYLGSEAMNVKSSDTPFGYVGPCFIMGGEKRPMCYTDKQRSRWGYCDCDSSSSSLNPAPTWSRPFSRWKSTHNAAFRGGDVKLITDAMNGPIAGVKCEAANVMETDEHWQAGHSKGESCYFTALRNLCLKKEYYPAGKWTAWQGFLSYEKYGSIQRSTNGLKAETILTCPPGEVFTGFAATGYDTVTSGSGSVSDKSAGVKEGLLPRCGVPNGFSVSSDVAAKYSRGDASDEGIGMYRHTVFFCPQGTVAIGMEYFPFGDADFNLWGGIVVNLLCANYTMTDPKDVEATRSCENLECGDGATTRTLDATAFDGTVSGCLERCTSQSSPLCHTFDVDVVAKTCTLYVNGSCSVSASDPRGSPAFKDESFKSKTPLRDKDGGAPVIFTPVEFNHPTSVAELTASTFALINVPKSSFTIESLHLWATMPWSSCSHECGNGYMTRAVFCAPRANQTVGSSVGESKCGRGLKPKDRTFCNNFHCKEECRLDVGRKACYLYTMDDRRRSAHSGIRQYTCESYGCCFLAKHDELNNTSVGPECYQQSQQDYPMWDPLPWEECNAECKTTEINFRTRENICVMNDGYLEESANCPTITPASRAECKHKQSCPQCGSPNKCGEYGKCERVSKTHKQWEYDEICRCIEGVSGAKCQNTASLDQNPKWSTGAWGACEPSIPFDATGASA